MTIQAQPVIRGTTPEVSWLLAALRGRYDVGRSVAPPPPDLRWGVVLQAARRHGVLQLLQPSFRSLGAEIPAAPQAQFNAEVLEIGLRNLALTGELLRVLDLLADAGIRALPYKGPVLAQVAYGDIGLRAFGDLDVLLDEDRVKEAIDLLQEDGYRAGWPWTVKQLRSLVKNGHDIALVNKDLVSVELQWAIGSRPHVVPRGVSTLLDRATSVRIAGRDVPSLSPTDLALVIAMHGSIHLWSRLSWVCDFVETCRSVPGVDLSAALRLADGVRSRRMLLLAVCVAEETLGVQVDAELAGLAQSDRHVVSLSRSLVPALSARGGPDIRRATTRVRDRVALADRWTDGVAGALRAVVTPTQSDWQTVSLPDRLQPLYYPIRSWRILRFAIGVGRDRTGADIFDVH